MLEPRDRMQSDHQEQAAGWTVADLGREAPCDLCGQPGVVIRAWPSLGAESPISARCPEHVPEDDYT